MTTPTPPIELTGSATRFGGEPVEIGPSVLKRLRAVCRTTVAVEARAEASRDWWPLAMHWALVGAVPQLAGAVCTPRSKGEVAGVLSVCAELGIPVTAAGGRSGVNGATVPAFGGVVLDLTQLAGIAGFDELSGVVQVGAGTFGPDLERELNDRHHVSVGHFPQSFDIATVGGWVACRGAGQYSTRYGKIESMVVGLEVVLADGRVVITGGAPAAAVGPDLTQVFVGSEGMFGVITSVWLRTHPLPAVVRSNAYSFRSFHDGLEACRRILRRGATPAVLRLYDADESKRGQEGDGTQCVLLVLDEGDQLLTDATMAVVADECAAAVELGDALVQKWTHHRNDTSALQALTRKGFVVDTLEIAAPWSKLDTIFTEVRQAMLAVPHARSATCHLSHSYSDGACLYFTFAATPPADEVESTYIALWNAGQRAVLAHGGNLSHHHGVGLNRGRFVREAMGASFDVLASLKHALDPKGILNPGKFGLPSVFGGAVWPSAT